MIQRETGTILVHLAKLLGGKHQLWIAFCPKKDPNDE